MNLSSRRIAISVVLIVAGIAPAIAASSFTLDNVTLDSGGTTYRASKLDVTDSALSRDEMQALFAGTDSASASQRFARVFAARITAPEIVSDQRTGEMTQSVTYRDVVLDKIVGGKIASATAASAIVAIKGPQTGDISGRTAAVVLRDIDLPGLAHMLVEGRTNPDEAARTILSGASVDDLDVDLPNGGHAHVARIEIRDAGGRALAVPMNSLVDLAPKPDAPAPGPERQRALSGVVADLLTSQSIAAIDFKDVTIQSAPANATTVKVGAFGLAGLAGGKVAHTSLDGLSVTSASTEAARIAHLSLDGIDMTPLLAASVSDDAPKQAPLKFGRIDVSELAANLPNVGKPIGLSIAKASIDAKDWRDLAPQTLGVAVNNFAFDLPIDDPRARPLLDLGYKRIDLSLAADAAYDAAKTELTVKRLSLSAPEIGNTEFSTSFTNVASELFGRDTEKARTAMAAMLFRHAFVTVTDTGLLSRMIDMQARLLKSTPADVRTRWATGVRAFVTATLADNADRGSVADAVERLIRNGGSFSLTADAPHGLGLIDAMLAGGAQGLLGKVKLTVAP